ncbi:MAG TPA: hypothetical protein VKZ18_09100 [Polyangia bacterium]|nr:hypothetical protein [Polyangia bacterium]
MATPEETPQETPPPSSSLLDRVLFEGPDPAPARREEADRWDTLLTWPVRWLAVAGVSVVAAVWGKSPGGIQLAWALQYALLAAVSIVASFWLPLFLINAGVALLWLAMSRKPPAALARETGLRLSDLVTWVNRQLGHIEALASWIAVSLVTWPVLWIQLGGLAAVSLLGPPIINGIARTDRVGGARARASRAVLMMERRSVIYYFTLGALLLLALQAPLQIRRVFPLFLTIVPALVVRFLRFRWRRRQERVPNQRAQEQVRGDRLVLAERQRKMATGTGWVGPAIVVGAFAVLTAVSIWQRGRLAAEVAAERDAAVAEGNGCRREGGGPLESTLGLFLVADSQFHDLDGKRFPGEMEAANAIVPVSRRPVELDMLSTASVVRLQSIYDRIRDQRAAERRSPPDWAHLGDLGDLSCLGEMDRAVKLFGKFGAGARLLAGVAPGNHDSTFQGNFDWSPFWGGACTTDRMDKTSSDEKLAGLLAGALPDPSGTHGLTGRAVDTLFLLDRPQSRFTMTRLGKLGGHGVLAIFIDTTDRQAGDFGIAGVFGSFSGQQREEILKAVAAQKEADPDYQDPWIVILGHVPFGELTADGQKQLAKLVATLDAEDGSRCARGATDCDPARVVALIAAHTHIAESHRHCIGQRLVREIVVGSMTDPPQQGAWLDLGLDAHGRASARLSTLPLVAREGFTCPGGGVPAGTLVPAGTCRDVVARLVADPECEELTDVERAGASLGGSADRTCPALEKPVSRVSQLEGIARYGGADDPQDLDAGDERRARVLVRCLCRKSALDATTAQACSAVPANPLTGNAYAPLIEQLARTPDRAAELTCLSWAASAVQSHKANGMTIADAVRCAFDDPTLPAAQVTVATAEEEPCR